MTDYTQKGTLYLEYHQNLNPINSRKIFAFKRVKNIDRAKQIFKNRYRPDISSMLPENINKAWFKPMVGMEVIKIK